MTDRNKHTDDEALDAYLRGDSTVSRAYADLEPVEPPAQLDRQIREAARHEISATRPDFFARLARHDWFKPLAAVAAMGLCLSLALRVIMEEPPGVAGVADVADVARAPQSELSAPEEVVVSARRREAATAAADAPSRPSAPPPSYEAYNRADLAGFARLGSGKADGNADGKSVELPLSMAARQNTPVALWNSGAKPARDVWQAGIDALRKVSDRERVRAEEARLARYDTTADDIADLASEQAWAAGIEWLQANGEAERAAEESARLQAVYPPRDTQR